MKFKTRVKNEYCLKYSWQRTWRWSKVCQSMKTTSKVHLKSSLYYLGAVYMRAVAGQWTRSEGCSHFFIIFFYVYIKPGRFLSRSGWVESRLFKAGSRHSRDNISHINTSSRDEKRPTLIFLEMYSNCKTRMK